MDEDVEGERMSRSAHWHVLHLEPLDCGLAASTQISSGETEFPDRHGLARHISGLSCIS